MAVMRLTRTGRNAVVGALAVLLIFVFIGVQVNHEKPEKKTASPARWTTALAEAPTGCSSQDGDSVTVDPTDASTTTAMGPNELAAGLVRLAKGVKQWRQRAVVNQTEPEATIVAQVKRFSTDAVTHARLAAARFSLDVQMEALEATRAGPGARAPPPQLPPRQEADTTFPEPSTFACRMLPDGFEICEYENVCLDIPSPALGEGQGYASQTDGVYFVGSDLVPSYAKRGQAWPRRRIDVVSAAPEHCRPLLVAADTHESWPATGDDAPPECQRWLRHWLRLYPLAENSIPLGTAQPFDHGFDAVFEDIPDLDIFQRRRLVPFGAPLHPSVIPPNATLSVAHGGSFPGVVTWVDNLYLARDILEAHLWGWSQTVSVPVLSAHWANMSAAWGLPPIDNLVVYGTPAWKKDQLRHNGATPWQPHAHANTDNWAMGYLRHALRFVTGGLEPWRAGELPSLTKAPERYPWLQAFVDTLTGGKGPAEGTTVPLPVAVPYDMALLAHPPGVGTRMIFSIADVPLPPDLVRASTELAGADVTVAPPPHLGAGPRDAGDLTAKVNTGLRRICGRRTVALGQKPFMIGGAAEGNAFRDFAYRQLNVPRPKRDGHFFPPRRATIVDRGMANNGRKGHEAYKTRGFANLPQMLEILKKYDVEYDVVTDAEIERMDFAQQAAVFGKNGLLIMAHGAGLSNAYSIPQRSCVIEIYPRGMWCDLYIQMMAAQGLHVFPIYSTLLGPKVEWQYVSGPKRNKQDPDIFRVGAECENKSLANNAIGGDCWPEYRYGAIYTPLAEFERTLLKSLELLGVRAMPRYSPVDMVEGVVQNAPGPMFWGEGVHEANQWILCPPPSHVLAAGGRTGTGAHRCMFPNGTWLDALPGVPPP